MSVAADDRGYWPRSGRLGAEPPRIDGSGHRTDAGTATGVELGFLFHQFRLSGPRITATARLAEAAGVASLWVMDHVQQIPWQGPDDDPVLECFTTLGFLAQATSRVTLGPLVSGVALRDPAMLVKQATTLDVLSGGRGVFGIGAGWYEREVAALGRTMPPLPERFALLEDTVRLARSTWAGDPGPFAGAALTLPERLTAPLPVRRPRPPILIGGSGERRTLRLVARHADACNLSFAHNDLAGVAAKIATLHRHCAAEGRDPAEIALTTTRTFGPLGSAADAEAQIAFLDELAGLGVGQHIFTLPDPSDERAWHLIAERIVPAAVALHAGRGLTIA